MMKLRPSLLAASIFAASWSFAAQAVAQTATPQAASAPSFEPSEGQPGKDVIWLPTSEVLVDRMLEMAKLTPRDRLVDLGSGDGRLVITAAKRGATAHGIEYNPDMVELSQRAAKAEGVSQRATFEKADIFESDFSKATIVTLFLLPDLNMRLRPTLLAMKPGTRIVSNSFNMGDWEPDQTQQVTEGCRTYCQAYQWTVPAQAAGTWRLGNGRELVLEQTFQMLEGTLREGGQARPVTDARMVGTRIQFTVADQRYTGEVKGSAMQGTVAGGGAWKATRAAR
jgi:hypothetical protein